MRRWKLGCYRGRGRVLLGAQTRSLHRSIFRIRFGVRSQVHVAPLSRLLNSKVRRRGSRRVRVFGRCAGRPYGATPPRPVRAAERPPARGSPSGRAGLGATRERSERGGWPVRTRAGAQ